MTKPPHRRLAALTLAAGCLSLSALCSLAMAENTEPASAGVRSLDPAADATEPLLDELTADLGALLQAAQYRRVKGDQAGPKNVLTSVRRLVDALLAHQGVAYVALAQRVEGGDAVSVDALYVLEGAADASAAVTPADQGAGKGAIEIDLDSDALRPLADTLKHHLGALLPAAESGSPASLAEVITALQAHRQVAYVLLTDRAGPALADDSRAFVVPDVLRISISDDAVNVAGETATEVPEVEMVPGPDGGPPQIKFEFDPEKYDITKQR